MRLFSELNTYITKKIAAQPKAYIVIEACVVVVLVLLMASNGCVQFRDIEREQATQQAIADSAFEE